MRSFRSKSHTVDECLSFIYFDINYLIGLPSEEDDTIASEESMGLCGQS